MSLFEYNTGIQFKKTGSDVNWAVIALGGIPNKTQVGTWESMDAFSRSRKAHSDWKKLKPRTYRSRKSARDALDNRCKAKADELQLEEKFYPIQVKQKEKVGRPDIDAFEAMMIREECPKVLRLVRLRGRRED